MQFRYKDFQEVWTCYTGCEKFSIHREEQLKMVEGVTPRMTGHRIKHHHLLQVGDFKLWKGVFHMLLEVESGTALVDDSYRSGSFSLHSPKLLSSLRVH